MCEYSKRAKSIDANTYYYESPEGISFHHWDADDNLICHVVIPWRLLNGSVRRHQQVSKRTAPDKKPTKRKATR